LGEAKLIDVSSKTTNAIYGYVRKDLEPSQAAVLSRIGGSLLSGGLLSLFFAASSELDLAH